MKVLTTPKNIQIIWEDNHLLIINKRVGDIVQGDKTKDIPLVEIAKIYLKEKHQKPGNVFLGVVHRLDRPTTGIVVFAKTSKALSRLNEMFQERNTQKTYLAIVNQIPPKPSDTLVHFLTRNTQNNISKAHSKEVPNSKKSSLSYELVHTFEKYFALKIELHTGRHHQIRAQLSEIGCSIKGDLKYGAARSNPDGGIHLHAWKLEFIHPVTKEVLSITAPVPNDVLWQKLSNKL
ncbi:MAG: RluA family pseudouridine synthase [Flavobacterium sp.]